MTFCIFIYTDHDCDHLVTIKCSSGQNFGPDSHEDATWHNRPAQTATCCHVTTIPDSSGPQVPSSNDMSIVIHLTCQWFECSGWSVYIYNSWLAFKVQTNQRRMRPPLKIYSSSRKKEQRTCHKVFIAAMVLLSFKKCLKTNDEKINTAEPEITFFIPPFPLPFQNLEPTLPTILLSPWVASLDFILLFVKLVKLPLNTDILVLCSVFTLTFWLASHKASIRKKN